MPLSFPTDPSFTSVNFKINTPLLRTITNSGKTTRVAMGHQFYTFTVKFPNMTPTQVGAISGFVAGTLGGYSAFEIILPKISYSKSTQQATGTLTVTTTVAAGVYQVLVSGAGANRIFLKAGDVIKFSNHSKVYQITGDIQADGSGNAVIYFSGALVSAVPSSTTITYNAVPFTVILDNDIQEFDSGFGGISTMSLDMREVW